MKFGALREVLPFNSLVVLYVGDELEGVMKSHCTAFRWYDSYEVMRLDTVVLFDWLNSGNNERAFEVYLTSFYNED